MVPDWFPRFQVGFFMVPGWFYMVFHVSRLVFHGFRWFFMVAYGSRWVFMVFHGSRLIFHGFRSVFMIFHGFRSAFKVFHGVRLVDYGSRPVFMVPGLCIMVTG